MDTNIKICSKIVLDETVPGIKFDENGVCHYCKIFDQMSELYPQDERREKRLEELVTKIKKDGKGKRYDCIVGVSGGTDSTFTLVKALELGLRPLAVHLDNGWNTDIAVKNIKKSCSELGIDLYTYVIEWEEFKDLQISFLKASTPDAEIPTDIAIIGTLIKTASKEGVKYILNGHSFRTEFLMPKGWNYIDGRYINSVQKKFGTKKLKSFPNFLLKDLLYYNVLRGIKIVPFLNYFEYDKESTQKMLIEKLDWEYYGGHHHENTYSKFYQSYLLPIKFGIDKRKTVLSAKILSGAITRDEALTILNTTKHFVDQETINYLISKLELTKEEFDAIMKLPKKTFHDYSTYYSLMKFLKYPILIACKLGILNMLIYYKFLDE